MEVCQTSGLTVSATNTSSRNGNTRTWHDVVAEDPQNGAEHVHVRAQVFAMHEVRCDNKDRKPRQLEERMAGPSGGSPNVSGVDGAPPSSSRAKVRRRHVSVVGRAKAARVAPAVMRQVEPLRQVIQVASHHPYYAIVASCQRLPSTQVLPKMFPQTAFPQLPPELSLAALGHVC